MASSSTASRQRHAPLPPDPGDGDLDSAAPVSSVPIHIVTRAAQIPTEFLDPSPERNLAIGFDCEGVDLCRSGKLCIMQALYFQYGIKLNNVVDTQIAYSLIEEQEGKKKIPDDYISFVGLLADPRYCGISYQEKEEVRILLRQDPNFWTVRPLSDMMIHAAADEFAVLSIVDVFASTITIMRTGQLCLKFQFKLFVADTLGFTGLLFVFHGDCYLRNGTVPEEETLSIIDVPPGKMGRVIGRRGASIMAIKKSCNAEIFIGGDKGPPNEVFIIGPVKHVRKAEAILWGRMLDIY